MGAGAMPTEAEAAALGMLIDRGTVRRAEVSSAVANALFENRWSILSRRTIDGVRVELLSLSAQGRGAYQDWARWGRGE